MGDTKMGKYLLSVIISWFLAACLFLFSNAKPPSSWYWGIVTFYVLACSYTVIILPAYLLKSWWKFASASDKTSDGIWLGIESLIIIIVEIVFAQILVDMLLGRISLHSLYFSPI